MQLETQDKNQKVSRKGQTLVEFAITLPVLLVLMFGVVEFGRIFQAWVSIQNSAREAVRYASTNSYNQRYDDLINLNRNNDPASIIPCVLDEDRSGNILTEDLVAGGNGAAVSYFDGNGAWDRRNSERLFATWYQGRDCNPFNESDQNLRRDLLRIVSIYETAYWASVGREDFPALPIQRVGVQDIGTFVSSPPTEDEKRQAEEDLMDFLYSVFNPNYPQYDPPQANTIAGQSAFPDTEADLRGYFSVMMCSNRPFLYENSEPIFSDYPNFSRQRFIQVIDPDPADTDLPNELKQVVLGSNSESGADVPGCFLNERPVGQGVENVDYTVNRGIRWLDPGAGGTRVTVVVSYFHPLVTPLGLAQFVPIHARRSAIVEDFQGAGAAAAFNPLDADGGGGDVAIIPDEEEEEGPEEPPLPDPTAEPTLPPPPTPFVAPPEFECTNIQLVEVDFNENLTAADRLIRFTPGRVGFRIENNNNTRAILKSVRLNWESAEYATAVAAGVAADPVPNYPGFHFSKFALSEQVHWEGQDYTPATDTTNPADGNVIESQVFSIPGDSTSFWYAEYQNGPLVLNDELPRGAFGNTEFIFINPLTNTECDLGTVLFDSTTQELDQEIDDNPSEDVTDCASEFVTFDAATNPFRDFGWVQLTITNNHPSAPAPISDFEVTWGGWMDRAESGSVLLQGIYVGGSTPPDGVQIWRSLDAAGTPLGVVRQGTSVYDDPGEYTPITRSDGVWTLASDDMRIPPGTSRNFWLDLNGGNAAEDERNMKIYDFNGSQVIISCPPDGGGDGGDGTIPSGRVDIQNEPLPAPSPTVELNDSPRANNDRYQGGNGFSGLVVHSVNSSNGVLRNDTDCEDDTPGRGVVGTPCSDDTNPSTFTNNGDAIRIDTCRNGCTTDLGGRIVIADDGSFTYDPTRSETLTCNSTGTVTDKRNYRIVDARGAKSTATIYIDIDVGSSGGNRPPEPVNASNSPQTYYYDMRTSSNPIGSADSDKVNLKDLFVDPNGDSFNITNSQNRSGLTVNDSNGTWSFNPWDDSNLVELGSGNTRTIDVSITVSDGDANCSDGTTKLRLIVTGQAEEVEDDPPPQEEPEDPDGPTFGGGAG